MPATSAAKLYTPDILALAVSLASYPTLPAPALHGEARSRTCGSAVEVSLLPDGSGLIEHVGMQVRACAIGQAAAALFARSAAGTGIVEIERTLDQLAGWLEQDGALPDWPGLDLLSGARAFPARHGAILLPWKAAQQALGKAVPAG